VISCYRGGAVHEKGIHRVVNKKTQKQIKSKKTQNQIKSKKTQNQIKIFSIEQNVNNKHNSLIIDVKIEKCDTLEDSLDINIINQQISIRQIFAHLRTMMLDMDSSDDECEEPTSNLRRILYNCSEQWEHVRNRGLEMKSNTVIQEHVFRALDKGAADPDKGYDIRCQLVETLQKKHSLQDIYEQVECVFKEMIPLLNRRLLCLKEDRKEKQNEVAKLARILQEKRAAVEMANTAHERGRANLRSNERDIKLLHSMIRTTPRLFRDAIVDPEEIARLRAEKDLKYNLQRLDRLLRMAERDMRLEPDEISKLLKIRAERDR